MALSGWFVGLLALGVVPVVLLGNFAAVAGWVGFVVLLAALDLLLAASARAVKIGRDLPARVRLGETVHAEVIITNVGRRTIRGMVRDAWQPSAGAVTTRHPLSIPPRERRAVGTDLTPFRRGERRSAHVTIRSFGPLHLAARQATITVPGALR
ncbi:MAG: hypothetical protein QOH44_1022, partial [Actinomycetota bacterium]|nr:hypothetical protein [Actinomycetota bacterium]